MEMESRRDRGGGRGRPARVLAAAVDALARDDEDARLERARRRGDRVGLVVVVHPGGRPPTPAAAEVRRSRHRARSSFIDVSE